jgi:hypothetical protein
MDRLNRMLASAGGMSGLNSAAPGSVRISGALERARIRETYL